VEATALWVVFAIAIMGLCTIQLGGVSAGRIAAAAAVLLAARVGGVVPATMTGVLCGFGAGFAVGDFTLYVTMYSLGGLLAGVFSAFGRVGSAVAFSAAYGFVGMLAGGSSLGFIEVAVSAVIFLLLPASWLKIFGAVATGEGNNSTIKSVITEQIADTATALRDVSKTTGDVAVRLGRMYTGDVGAIYDRAGERVCRRCPSAMHCWQEHYNDTVDALAHGLRQIMAEGSMDPDDFPESFDHCPKRKEMGIFLQHEHLRHSHKDEERRRAAQTRRLLTDQMEGIALVMEDLVDDIGDIYAGDSVLEAKVEALFAEHRLEPQRVSCWRNRQGQLTVLVEIPQYKEPRCAPELLAQELSEPCRTAMTFPVISRRSKVSRLTFRERPKYTLEYGSYQINCGNNALCGDSFRIINTTGTMANLLLSDGMGSGNSAAVDSAMAASLITRLLEAGVSYPAALKLINGALLVKSGDESMATIDAAQVDLYTGKVRFYKAGAAPTVVRKEGRGIEIDATSLPAGILDEVEFHQSQITLEEGDMLLLLSDGAVPEGGQWIARAVESFESGDLDQFCKKLATTAKLRRTDGRDDDITVLCCRLVAAS
ncbi:MAG: SpoIIE family protein phosphatase, partial [Angelakisella sp.]